jgi:hypothetical protein
MDEEGHAEQHALVDENDATRHLRQLTRRQLEALSLGSGSTPLGNRSLAASDVSSFVGLGASALSLPGMFAAEASPLSRFGMPAADQPVRGVGDELAADAQATAKAPAAPTDARSSGEERGTAARGKAPTSTEPRILFLAALVAIATSTCVHIAISLSSGVQLAVPSAPVLVSVAAGTPASAAARDSAVALGWAAGVDAMGSAAARDSAVALGWAAGVDAMGSAAAAAAGEGGTGLDQLLTTGSFTQLAHGMADDLPAEPLPAYPPSSDAPPAAALPAPRGTALLDGETAAPGSSSSSADELLLSGRREDSRAKPAASPQPASCSAQASAAPSHDSLTLAMALLAVACALVLVLTCALLRVLTVTSAVSSAAKSARKPSARKEPASSQSSGTQPEQSHITHARIETHPSKRVTAAASSKPAAAKPPKAKGRVAPAPSMAAILETTLRGAPPAKPKSESAGIKRA